jgi:hypothetical protein
MKPKLYPPSMSNLNEARNLVGPVHGTRNKDWLAKRTPKPGPESCSGRRGCRIAMKQRNGPLPPPATEFEVYAGVDFANASCGFANCGGSNTTVSLNENIIRVADVDAAPAEIG